MVTLEFLKDAKVKVVAALVFIVWNLLINRRLTIVTNPCLANILLIGQAEIRWNLKDKLVQDGKPPEKKSEI